MAPRFAIRKQRNGTRRQWYRRLQTPLNYVISDKQTRDKIAIAMKAKALHSFCQKNLDAIWKELLDRGLVTDEMSYETIQSSTPRAWSTPIPGMLLVAPQKSS
ncbi:unnamed protein product [Amoebophrya sp. A120]|nr:unnamed protein product [Amoebophrya sp. A120]|eukprot:GSA120T00004229001.1